MSNTKVKAIGAAKPTQEELEAQAKRAFMQKRNSLAELILANSFHSQSLVRTSANGTPDFRPFVDAALDAADYFMQKVYSLKVTEE